MSAICLLQAAPGASVLAGPLGSVVPIVLLLGMFWVLLVLPAQKQRKQLEVMRGALKPGDEILTSSGIYGTVTRLRERRVHVRVAEGVQVEMDVSAVSTVLTPKEGE